VAHVFKYFVVSAGSLVIDLSSFHLITKISLFSIPVTATISYCVGLTFAYFVFTHSIFKNSKLSHRKLLQASLFGLSGLLGSATTYLASVIAHNFLGANAWSTKMFAVIASFFLVYLFRIKYIFQTVDNVRQ